MAQPPLGADQEVPAASPMSAEGRGRETPVGEAMLIMTLCSGCFSLCPPWEETGWALRPCESPSSTDPPGWAVWVTLGLSTSDLSMELQLGSSTFQAQIPCSRAAAG